MTEHRVSGTIEAIEPDIGSSLGTPTAFASPSFSVRSSLPPGVLLDMHSVFNHGDDFGGVTDAHSGEPESSMFSNALRLEGLPGRTSMDADGVLPARPFPSHHPPQIQFEDTPSTDGRVTLSPSPASLTPQDREVPLVDPFEELRAYAKRGRSPLGGCTERNAVLDADAIKPVAYPTTNPTINECEVALRGLSTGCPGPEFAQMLPLSNSPRANCGVEGIYTSGSSLDHGHDAEWPRFESSRTNAKRHPSNNEQPHSHTREFHIQLAATNLGRERGTVRVPMGADLDYIRFREELKQALVSKGDECIWRGLESQDDPRL